NYAGAVPLAEDARCRFPRGCFGFHDGTVSQRVPRCNPLAERLCVTRTDTSSWPCTIARRADVLGDHWNLLLIRQACLGTRRFDDFQSSLGIGRNILSLRLNRLVAEGILSRVEYQQSPSRHEYRLTDKGREVH